MQIQLDLSTQRVIYSAGNGPQRELYVISSAQRAASASSNQPDNGGRANIDTRYYYQFTTAFKGPGMCLDVINRGARNNTTHLVKCTNHSGQYWQLVSAGQGFFRLTTLFRGAQMCLDVYNGGARNNQVHLAQCANYSGQLWHAQPDRQWHRLSTQFRGPQNCLDIFNGGPDDGRPHLAPCTNYSGQLWLLRRTDRAI